MDERWLRCKVLQGMFSDELGVLITTVSGDSISVFVPKERVRGSLDQEGRVQIRSFQSESKWWAVLPNESQTIVPVDAGQLLTA